MLPYSQKTTCATVSEAAMLSNVVPRHPQGLAGFTLFGGVTMTVCMAVVIDYQNVHLTAAQLFLPGRPIEESLIEPFRFAKQLAKARNSDGLHEVKVARIEVFRGIPIPDDDPDGYRRNLEQKSQWEHGHQGMVSVTLRPLKYNWEWHDGQKTPIRSTRREKASMSCVPSHSFDSHDQETTMWLPSHHEIQTLPPPLTRHTNSRLRRSKPQSGMAPPTDEHSATSKPMRESGRLP